MRPKMYSERCPLAEAFPTVLAGVWLLTAVHSFVHDEVIFFRETLRAVCAGVRLKARVHSVMYPQLVFLSESLPARIAKVFFLVRQRVLHVLLFVVFL